MKNGWIKNLKKVVVPTVVLGTVLAGATYFGVPQHITAPKNVIKQEVQDNQFVEYSAFDKYKEGESFYNNYETEILNAMKNAFGIEDVEDEFKFRFLKTLTDQLKLELVHEKNTGEKSVKEVKEYADRMDYAIDYYATNMDVINSAVGTVLTQQRVDDLRKRDALFKESVNIDGYEEEFAVAFLTEVNLNNKKFATANSQQNSKNLSANHIALATTALAGIGIGTAAFLKNKQNTASLETEKHNQLKKKENTLEELLKDIDDSEMER